MNHISTGKLLLLSAATAIVLLFGIKELRYQNFISSLYTTSASIKNLKIYRTAANTNAPWILDVDFSYSFIRDSYNGQLQYSYPLKQDVQKLAEWYKKSRRILVQVDPQQPEKYYATETQPSYILAVILLFPGGLAFVWLIYQWFGIVQRKLESAKIRRESRPPTVWSKIQLAIVTVFMLTFTIYLGLNSSISGLWSLYLWSQFDSLELTQGQVISREVIFRRGNPATASGSARYDSYFPIIHYSYSINGNRYEGNSAINAFAMPAEQSQDFIRPYRPGKEIDVYYDPGNPAISLITDTNLFDNGISKSVIGLPLFVMGLLALAQYIFGLFVKIFSSKKNE